ncbi:MAG: hypothetical protein A3C80_00285 [Candidatus Ryanbacteria bacterium RIFCSPHIGHO2_02_FULL_45_43]|uniref:DUF5652 domain-containing protein n=1 Tax=Candidatus Ryanbacteria bacterium RIFCSPHIGHO2_01_45_13 TaxID=1802112 RepID=A0A1G2G102_9BACT|nr:MAG: hypothetical protein A2718_01670 [Candidatus Ryanbacteria bacterium RIFCSPHIGHO2_01_FULL_44_130]OGZ43777.1 MAG: hypothetical protein A2W41_04790 [Candidatus Ryanbacteria bacterium RIFCSPHIGHO2_01_45_13]OGZ47719.1 MAG: hypothetical protein A3C80_00285 [Candidatus Ryanbacteria bacterium RIFCSPHIGHO2_02_FULL_45_43]OGZ49615.1 MAG: hypothetical protein A3E55_04285 [Candidatus Ryanbacteria bacterium RIFCSPHIGHO2_12_FULL_44_20]OGZ51297.1 MAG: hypothetical protein A3A17_04610 [Candidatus Ryanba
MEELSTGFVIFILAVALWTLPWKGYALWKSARLSDKRWFIVLLVLNTLAIVDIFYIFKFSKRQSLTSKQESPTTMSADN